MRHPSARVAAALVTLALLAGSPPISGAPAAPGPAPIGAHLDPALLRALDSGPAIAIMSWDPAAARRPAIARYLRDAGLRATVFERVPVAYACAGSAADARAMAAAPGARSVVANAPLTPALDRSVRTAFNGDPEALWSVRDITGKGVKIAVVDTGVDGRHPDVRYGTRMHTNVRVVFDHSSLLGPYPPLCEPDRYTDEFFGEMENTDLSSGHGTFIASVAAGDGSASGGRYTGVAPEAEILGVGVADTLTARVDGPPGCAARGDESYEEAYTCQAQVSTLGAIAAIEFILSRHVEVAAPTKVILAGWTLDGLYDPWHPLTSSIDNVSYYGVSFVVPAGNEGPAPSDCSQPDTCHFNPVGAGTTPISVAAGLKTSRRVLAPYSSRGDPVARTYHLDTHRYEPTLTAPGDGVVAARATVATSPLVQPPLFGRSAAHGSERIVVDPSYVGMSGTSVAAAHVAGAIALMQEVAVRAKGCYLTAAQVREILAATASPMPGYEAWEVGAGMIDVTLAVEYAEFWPKITSREKYMCPPT